MVETSTNKPKRQAATAVKADMSLPHSIEAEKAVLGGILSQADSLLRIEGMLRVEHFLFEPHQKIYAAILDLSAKNESADILTVADRLRSDKSELLSPAYLVELTENCPVTQNIEHYAKIVRTDFYRRRVILACHESIRNATHFHGSIESYIEKVEKEFLAIASEHDRKGIMPGRMVLDATIEDIERRLANPDPITGVPSGFMELDLCSGGWQKSDLVILAARPGMGKTAFVLNCATYAAKQKRHVVVFTLEMAKEQLMSRIISTEARVDSSRLRRGDLSEDEEDRLAQGIRHVYTLSEFMGIDETPGLTLMELRSRCRRYQRETGIDLVIIDYLQLMSSSSRGDNREREISEISMGLKALAKELQIPVIALAQLNRGPDSRPDKRPKISDLRESGSMEQDADMILFIYRDEYYNPTSEDQGVAEILIAKNRHGATHTVKLAYQANFVAFQNLYKGPVDVPL